MCPASKIPERGASSPERLPPPLPPLLLAPAPLMASPRPEERDGDGEKRGRKGRENVRD